MQFPASFTMEHEQRGQVLRGRGMRWWRWPGTKLDMQKNNGIHFYWAPPIHPIPASVVV